MTLPTSLDAVPAVPAAVNHHTPAVIAAWAALVAAQKAWIVYRDAQKKSIVETYGHMDGTMYIPMSASAVMEITKDRALFLKSLKELISER